MPKIMFLTILRGSQIKEKQKKNVGGCVLYNNNNNNNSLYLYSAFSKRVMLKSADQRQGLQSSVGVGKFK